MIYAQIMPLAFFALDSLVLLTAVCMVWRLMRGSESVGMNQAFMTAHVFLLTMLTTTSSMCLFFDLEFEIKTDYGIWTAYQVVFLLVCSLQAVIIWKIAGFKDRSNSMRITEIREKEG